MSNKIFVGNLSWDTKDDGLREFFSQFGTVTSASVITFRDTGRSKGFGFVEFDSAEAAEKAIKEGNEAELDGRPINVNEAKPPKPREDNFRRNDRHDRGDRRRDY